ncbi:predicted protein [Chaetoceros tenuissimus]|uniref:Uncharacterized protein n=1 Tax=Chaetoceros tenuissimus TaxID=426638 RepID=A0AAD3H402_9STRA|nr:predicted protein [Chaetoceros tenuissimus]
MFFKRQSNDEDAKYFQCSYFNCNDMMEDINFQKEENIGVEGEELAMMLRKAMAVYPLQKSITAKTCTFESDGSLIEQCSGETAEVELSTKRDTSEQLRTQASVDRSEIEEFGVHGKDSKDHHTAEFSIVSDLTSIGSLRHNEMMRLVKHMELGKKSDTEGDWTTPEVSKIYTKLYNYSMEKLCDRLKENKSFLKLSSEQESKTPSGHLQTKRKIGEKLSYIDEHASIDHVNLNTQRNLNHDQGNKYRRQGVQKSMVYDSKPSRDLNNVRANAVHLRLYQKSVDMKRSRDVEVKKRSKPITVFNVTPSEAQIRLYEKSRVRQEVGKLRRQQVQQQGILSPRSRVEVKNIRANSAQLRLFQRSLEKKQIENAQLEKDSTPLKPTSAMPSEAQMRLYGQSKMRQEEGKHRRLQVEQQKKNDSPQSRPEMKKIQANAAQLRLYQKSIDMKKEREDVLHTDTKELLAPRNAAPSETQLRLYEQSKSRQEEGKLRRQQLQEYRRNVPESRRELKKIHANAAQLRLYQKSVESKKTQTQILDEDRENDISINVRKTTPSKTQIRLYEQSRSRQEEGRLRREEVKKQAETARSPEVRPELKNIHANATQLRLYQQAMSSPHCASPNDGIF